MRVKQEIIGKEVVDISGLVIGKVIDVEVDFETQTLDELIVGKGGILQNLGISKKETIVTYDLVKLIGDKVLLNGEIRITE
jgi:sporulation protein YlmC with PRC-barrel domain